MQLLVLFLQLLVVLLQLSRHIYGMKPKITPLRLAYDALPKSINFGKVILPQLIDNGISRDMFFRDLKAVGQNVPYKRLAIYAALFDTTVADLGGDVYQKAIKKVKPIIRKSFAKKVGLKS